MSDTVENADKTVAELLEAIKNPTRLGVHADGAAKCTFMRKVGTLPENVQEAIAMALEDQDVVNEDFVVFINSLQGSVRVHVHEVQKHRSRKRGCSICSVGA